MKFIKTLNEIKREGWDALVEKLGIAGATMFVMEHEKGYGDYTEERKKIFAEKSLVSCQPCNVVNNVVYYFHNQPGRIGYEEIHSDTCRRRTRSSW